MSNAVSISADVYARAQIAPMSLPGPYALAEALLTQDAVYIVGPPRRLPRPTTNVARLAWHVDRWELYIADAAAIEDINAAICVAIAQWYRTVHAPNMTVSDEHLGQHLLLPDEVLSHFAEDLGMARDEIAWRFRAHERVVAARLAELRASRLASGTVRVATAHLRLLG